MRWLSVALVKTRAGRPPAPHRLRPRCRSIVFDNEEENKLVYTELHKVRGRARQAARGDPCPSHPPRHAARPGCHTTP